MTSDLVPYNITFSDQSPMFVYLPHRDGPLETGWNVSYTSSFDFVWGPDKDFPYGTSRHGTTFAGATVMLVWTGTGVSFYGNASAGTFRIEVDAQAYVHPDPAPEGVLFNLTGLEYMTHSVVFITGAGGATITGATITVGMGEKGVAVQTQNISTVTDSTPETANPFFTVNSNDWSISQILGPSSSTPEVYPRITTDVQNAALSFDLNSTLAFAIYGSMDYNHGSFNVFVTPEAGIDYPLSNQFNASSRWLAMDQLLYLVTGMNASQSYRVDITNGVDGVFDMANVVLYGLPTTTSSTGPTSTGTTTATPSITESSGPQSANTSTSHPLKTGAIVGIVVACLGLMLAIIALLIRRRRLRSDEDEFVIQPADFVEVSPFPLSVGSEQPRPPPERISNASPPPDLLKSESRSQFMETLRSTARPHAARPSSPPASVASADALQNRVIIRELDAGPVVEPPLYDPTWLER